MVIRVRGSRRCPDFTLPTWDEVQRVPQEYEPRTDDRLVIDSTDPLVSRAPADQQSLYLKVIAVGPGLPGTPFHLTAW